MICKTDRKYSSRNGNQTNKSVRKIEGKENAGTSWEYNTNCGKLIGITNKAA